MATTSSPTVFKRYVALEMLKLREAAGLKREQVAEHLGCTGGHVRHIETMVSLPKPVEVRALFPLYGVNERVEPFLKLIDAARRGRNWWADIPGIPKWLDMALGMEAAAVTINSYDAMIVPGLLQTPRYTEALIRAGEPNLPESDLQPHIDLRMQRQDVLVRPEPPAVWCVLDESVLYRRPSDPEVLREQLEHLVNLTKLPNVHIQVLPFSALGLHAGMAGTFTVLTFAPELVGDPGIVYIESLISGSYYEDPAEITRYRDAWSRVQLEALSPDDTRTMLSRRAEEITAA